MKVSEVSALINDVVNEVSKVIVDKDDVIKLLLMAVLANGHVLIEDFPGLAKTLIAKSIAKVLGCKFSRVQFTPDLLPADIIGSMVYNQVEGSFEFRSGPIFTNILLGDEINRAPPKTQSALLEAMQEHQVTVEGKTYKLPDPFIVIATQNPIEYEGTYPLPEAQVDRFMIKLSVGYPSKEGEIDMLKRRILRRADDVELKSLATPEIIIDSQRAIEDVYVSDEILKYIVNIVRATRNHNYVEVGVSPRGTLALLKLSRVRAVIEGRDYVIPDDVKEVAPYVLSHRLILKSELWIKGVRPEQIIMNVINEIEVPKSIGK
ncbi:MAG: AAA family ATPase [Thermoprotei archaeon]